MPEYVVHVVDGEYPLIIEQALHLTDGQMEHDAYALLAWLETAVHSETVQHLRRILGVPNPGRYSHLVDIAHQFNRGAYEHLLDKWPTKVETPEPEWTEF